MDPFHAASELLAGGRHDLAEPLVKRGLAADPDSAFGHALLALCLHHQEREGAVEAARQAVALGPALPFCHYVLGMVLLKAKQVPAAEEAAMTALDLDPENESHLGLLGHVRVAQKRHAEALALADQGLRIDPNDLNCLNLRIHALRQLGRNAEAQIAAREILQRHPDDEVAHLQAGIARQQILDDAGAHAHFGEALRLDPTNVAVARAFEEGGSGGGTLWVMLIGAVFGLVGGLMPWTNPALTGRCLRGLTWLLPVVVLVGVWGRRSRRLPRLLFWGGLLGALLGGAWIALRAGRLVEARAALTAAGVVALLPGAASLRGV